MSEKHENPYRDGIYHNLFGFARQKQVFTRSDLMTYAVEKLGMTVTAANAAVTVIMSPRKESKRGDCRGNMSAAGHIYYMEKLARQVKGGVKDDQKYRLRYRTPALEARKRNVKIAVNSEKTQKTEVTVDAPVTEKV